MQIRIHKILHNNFVNGPSENGRTVIWTQGCPHACPGCFNPQTWADKGGETWDVCELAQYILRKNPDGLTLSGGEPLAQSESLLELLKYLHDENSIPRFKYGIICFSGYTLEEIYKNTTQVECLKYIDLLIEGRFIQSLKHNHSLSGSSNQRLIWNENPGRGCNLISKESVDNNSQHNIQVYTNDNKIYVTGFPVRDKKWLSEMGIE